MKDYGIIIPAHNEAEHIESFVGRFIRDLPDAVRGSLLEVILVENGSTDGTAEACRRLQEQFPDLVRVLVNERPSYGEAIKRGMLESRGRYLSILECDFLDREFVSDSLELLRSGKTRFIVASKRHPRSVDERPFKRRMLTLGFNLILNLFLGYPGSDTHGLKSIETSLAQELCQRAQTTDELFQTELALLAWRWGNRIEELPISIREQRPTTVSVARRLPKVAHMVWALRKSIKRFPRAPVSG